jgi:hypothetical protein
VVGDYSDYCVTNTSIFDLGKLEQWPLLVKHTGSSTPTCWRGNVRTYSIALKAASNTGTGSSNTYLPVPLLCYWLVGRF